jgi:hypothetical protein
MRLLAKTYYPALIKIKCCKASFLKMMLTCFSLLVIFPYRGMARRLDIVMPGLGISIFNTNKQWNYKINIGGWGLIFDKRFPSNRTGWSWAFPWYRTPPYTTTQKSITTYFLGGAVGKYSYDFTKNFSLDLSLGAGLVVNHLWKLDRPQNQENPSNHIYPTPILMLYLNSKIINGTSTGLNFLFFYQRGLEWSWWPEINLTLTFPIPLPPEKQTVRSTSSS